MQTHLIRQTLITYITVCVRLIPEGRIKLPDPSVRMGGYLGDVVPSCIRQSSPSCLRLQLYFKKTLRLHLKGIVRPDYTSA